MSREIKFRAYHEYLGMSPGRGFVEWIKAFEYLKIAPQSEYVWMQFTGLHDKNGKEIYEGDILENKNFGGVGKIIWGIKGETYAGWGIEWLRGREGKHDLLYYENFKNCEVIGNIYENPELLQPTTNDLATGQIDERP